MPSGPLRRKLRAAGHHLSAVVQVGKEGASDAVVRQLEQALHDHELVKVKVGTESPEDRFEAAERLAAAAGAQLAQILGRTLLLYKKRPQKPAFEAAERTPEEPVARARPAARGRSARGRPRTAPKRGERRR